MDQLGDLGDPPVHGRVDGSDRLGALLRGHLLDRLLLFLDLAEFPVELGDLLEVAEDVLDLLRGLRIDLFASSRAAAANSRNPTPSTFLSFFAASTIFKISSRTTRFVESAPVDLRLAPLDAARSRPHRRDRAVSRSPSRGDTSGQDRCLFDGSQVRDQGFRRRRAIRLARHRLVRSIDDFDPQITSCT